MVTSSRSNRLVARVQKIEAALPPLEKSVLAQRSHLHFAYTAGMPFWSPLPNSLNQGKVTVRMGGNWFNFSNSDMPAYDRNDVPNSSTNKVLLVGNTSTLVYLECLFLLLKWLLFPVLRVFLWKQLVCRIKLACPYPYWTKSFYIQWLAKIYHGFIWGMSWATTLAFAWQVREPKFIAIFISPDFPVILLKHLLVSSDLTLVDLDLAWKGIQIQPSLREHQLGLMKNILKKS